jgi:hypothetical protein
MPTIALSREFKGASAGEAYEATLNKLPDLDFIIWKTRPLAWLMIANRDLPEGKVNANISFRPGDGAVLTLSLSCETMDEPALREICEELADALGTLFAPGS